MHCKVENDIIDKSVIFEHNNWNLTIITKKINLITAGEMKWYLVI